MPIADAEARRRADRARKRLARGTIQPDGRPRPVGRPMERSGGGLPASGGLPAHWKLDTAQDVQRLLMAIGAGAVDATSAQVAALGALLDSMRRDGAARRPAWVDEALADLARL